MNRPLVAKRERRRLRNTVAGRYQRVSSLSAGSQSSCRSGSISARLWNVTEAVGRTFEEGDFVLGASRPAIVIVLALAALAAAALVTYRSIVSEGSARDNFRSISALADFVEQRIAEQQPQA